MGKEGGREAGELEDAKEGDREGAELEVSVLGVALVVAPVVGLDVVLA